MCLVLISNAPPSCTSTRDLLNPHLEEITLLNPRWFLTTIIAAATLVGCSLKPHWPDPEKMIGERGGVTEAIRFTLEGGPVDTTPTLADQLTAADAVRLALAHHPEVHAAIARVHAAKAQAQRARLLPNPVLSVVMRFPESGGSPIVEAGLTAELLSILTIPGRSAAADQRLRAAAADAVTAALDVIAEVETAYINAQSLEALNAAGAEQLSLVRRLRGLAQHKLDAGEGTRLDVTTLDSQLAEIELDTAERLLELGQSRLALARLIGQPSSPADWRLDPVAAEPGDSLLPEESVWLSAAYKNRPEIQSKRWLLASLSTERKLAQWSPLDGLEAGVETEHDEESAWSTGPAVSVPLPIFEWGQTRRAEADALRAEASHQLTQIRRLVTQEVRQAYAMALGHQRMLRQLRETLIPLLHQRQADAEAQFLGGDVDAVSSLLAEQDLRSASIRLITLQTRHAESLVRLRRAAGGIVPSSNETPATVPATQPGTPTVAAP